MRFSLQKLTDGGSCGMRRLGVPSRVVRGRGAETQPYWVRPRAAHVGSVGLLPKHTAHSAHHTGGPFEYAFLARGYKRVAESYQATVLNVRLYQ
jgi:hypothetical protein